MTGEKFQEIVAVADCIRKTFVIPPFNIGIQFIGIGYFPDNGHKYPLSYFIPRLSEGIIGDDTIVIKFQKIYSNLKKLTQKENTGQYVNGIICGYENLVPYIATFNTFIDNFNVNPYEIGAYVESQKCDDTRPSERDSAVKYLNEKIAAISQIRPQDVGGPIEVLEINPDGTNSFLQENDNLFDGNLEQLIYKWNNDIASINGQILNPPVRQKLNL